MQNIKGILVSAIVPMENHMTNGGEKLLGNASSIKRRNDGRVYISGQMQRHALFSAIDRLNMTADNRGNTFVSNGDGIGSAIEVDLRADMGGFMHPSAGSYSGRRTAPLTVTPAVAMAESYVTRDLLIRLKVTDGNASRDQALATREMSDSDLMLMNFFLDLTTLSISKQFRYDGEFHVETQYVKHVTEAERMRRVHLFLEATRSLTDYANQARNAVSGEPQQVLIVLDSKLSRKACRYFEAGSTERANLQAELSNAERGAWYITGNDVAGNTSVDAAYQAALTELATSTLFDPCGGDANVRAFADAFPN